MRHYESGHWLTGMFIFLCGWGIILYQIYRFLRYGLWWSLSFLDFVGAVYNKKQSMQDWVASPETWQGLHYVFSVTPLSLVAIVVGYLILLMAHFDP
ncbi:hypothetical protein M2360_003679 [Rhizobium sp. SG_E_25_P2]|uniref:hypothetical protein n=1 Tax=Rhizobium sp. SG_E_25_P2 TaxID=2879942 RepID=UPI002474035F|nr:hypothetical protein [Rhizobium sp. SG_E_25_P2]MDH6268274.1 hypothetical protein [Rhizobium sp. SG_E_25_P2]